MLLVCFPPLSLIVNCRMASHSFQSHIVILVVYLCVFLSRLREQKGGGTPTHSTLPLNTTVCSLISHSWREGAHWVVALLTQNGVFFNCFSLYHKCKCAELSTQILMVFLDLPVCVTSRFGSVWKAPSMSFRPCSRGLNCHDLLLNAAFILTCEQQVSRRFGDVWLPLQLCVLLSLFWNLQ